MNKTKLHYEIVSNLYYHIMNGRKICELQSRKKEKKERERIEIQLTLLSAEKVTNVVFGRCES